MTKEGIAFVIYEYGNQIGYTDLNGEFTIKLDLTSCLKIKSLGYENLTISTSELVTLDKIFLTRSIEQLEPVNLILNKSEITLKQGNRPEMFSNFGIPSGHTFLTKILKSDSNKSYRINRIKIYFHNLKQLSKKNEKRGLSLAFKFTVLNKDLEIIHEELILSNDEKFESHLVFDLGKGNIFLDQEPIYFGIENIGLLNHDGSFNSRGSYIAFKLSDKVFNEFELSSYTLPNLKIEKELYSLDNIFHNAYKDGDIKAPTGLPPTEVYNLNPMMEFTVTEYEK